ncbi:MAG: hypothetical protein ACE14L_12310 [Terriglobales bacterium]
MKRCFGSGLGLFTAMALIATLSITVAAQTATSAPDPLVQVLVQKGVLTAEDAKAITGTPTEQRDRLAQLLKQKGVITDAEYDAVRSEPVSSAPSSVFQPVRMAPATAGAAVVPAIYTQEKPPAKPAAPPPAPAIIPAVAPIRVLQLDPAKPGGMVPDITLGTKAKLKLYGFLKASAVYDSAMSGGAPFGSNDFPLPGFLGDTGPDGSPEFHIKARAARVGVNFEWPDVSKKLALTGKLEFDFEGNYTRANNRNISTVRSSQPSIRLAWMRMDYRASDTTSYFALFGQDWTTFGSSTLPNSLETTGLGIGFGSLYERSPQMRVGMTHNFGGSRNFTFGPEFAIALPAFGLTPSDISNQLAYGERQGSDSVQPETQGRLVFQFQADKAKGVAPAQIIFSGTYASRSAIVLAANVPDDFKPAFPRGAVAGGNRWGATAEVQLPTRYLTFLAKYYKGQDLRYYFAGQIYTLFNDLTNIFGPSPGVARPASWNVASVDGSSTVAFGCLGAPCSAGGTPVIADQLAGRSQGGFVELGIPLSRIFNAEPTGRNAGWTMNLHYGIDTVAARDVRRLAPGGGRGTSDWSFANLMYKLNAFVTFGYELGYYRTRAVAGTTGGLPLFRGVPSRQMHDLRSEFATIFTF